MTDERPRDQYGQPMLKFTSAKSASMHRAAKIQAGQRFKEDLARAIHDAEPSLVKRSGGIDRLRDGSLASRVKVNKQGQLYFKADDTGKAHELQLKDGRLFVKGPDNQLRDFAGWLRLLE